MKGLATSCRSIRMSRVEKTKWGSVRNPNKKIGRRSNRRSVQVRGIEGERKEIKKRENPRFTRTGKDKPGQG